MTSFLYTAVDGRGQPVSGEVAAPDADAALRHLKGYGLFHGVISEREAQGGTRPLSLGQAADLASQIVDLAKAGLPLAAGLWALADELPRSRVSQTMRAMAAQLDAGQSLEEAIQSRGAGLPAPMRAMIAAGDRSGRLAVVLEQFVELEQARADLRRRLWTLLAYPTVLLLLLAPLFLLFSLFIVPGFKGMFEDFGMMLPVVTQFTLSFYSPAMNGQVLTAGFLVLLLFFLSTTGRPMWAQGVLYQIPVVGTVWRWSRLAEFSRLMALLFDQQVPLPEALRLTAAGLSDSDLVAACRKAADRVEAGSTFPESLVGLRSFPAEILPLVEWGQYAPQPAEAMRAVTEMCEDRARTYADLLETFVSPLLFLLIVGFVGMTLVSLFLPMMSLIRWLSGGF